MLCPNCHAEIGFPARLIVRDSYRCPACSASLAVSPSAAGPLVALAILVGILFSKAPIQVPYGSAFLLAPLLIFALIAIFRTALIKAERVVLHGPGSLGGVGYAYIVTVLAIIGAFAIFLAVALRGP